MRSTAIRPRPTIILALVTSALLVAIPLASAQAAPGIDFSRELFITHIRVVDGSRTLDGRPWSFGGLMSRLAGEIPPELFVEAWVETLTNTSVVNRDPTMMDAGIVVPKQKAMKAFFDAWRDRGDTRTLDLRAAPFRLLAIVNRPDLLSVSEGEVYSAGEARFIFAAVDPSDEDPANAQVGARRFFVIFEYGIPAESCSDLQNWHRAWHELSAHAVGSPRYNAALQLVTDAFTLPDPAYPAPNGSQLNQLRTNEFQITLDSALWDLREWNLIAADGASWRGLLESVTTKQTPSFSYIEESNRNAALGSWLENNGSEILNGTHEVKEEIRGPGSPAFLGGMALNDRGSQIKPPNEDDGGGISAADGNLWWAPGYANDDRNGYMVNELQAEVRHRFALQTCSGCHFAETRTDGTVPVPGSPLFHRFSMTTVREAGFETQLSPFLKGTGPFPDPVNPIALRVDDPIGPAGPRQGPPVAVELEFNDLARRESVLQRILEVDCDSSAPGALSPLSQLEQIASEIGNRVH